LWVEAGPGQALKELKRENARLRKAVTDLALDKQILSGVAQANY
jgi:hypothetical protein